MIRWLYDWVTSGPRVYVDCDGVLADFDSAASALLSTDPRVQALSPHVAMNITAREYEDRFGSDDMWSRVRDRRNFYEMLLPMPDAHELMEFLRPLRPTILTGSPDTVPEAHLDKQRWVRYHFGPTQPVITCRSRDKSNFCRRGDVIIDDFAKHSAAWEGKGGRWVLHSDAATSIAVLRRDIRFRVRHGVASFLLRLIEGRT